MNELFRSLGSELSPEIRQLARLSETQRAHHDKLQSDGVAARVYARFSPSVQADIDRRGTSYQTIVARLPATPPLDAASQFTRYAVCFRLPNIGESGELAPPTLYTLHIGDRDRSVVMPNHGFEASDIVTVSHMADELQTMHDNGLFVLTDSLTELYGLPDEAA